MNLTNHPHRFYHTTTSFIVLLSFAVLLLLTSSPNTTTTLCSNNVTLEGESVPLSDFSNSTGFNITLLSLEIEFDPSIGSNISTFNYNVFWNETAGIENHVNLTSFALAVCPSLRFAIIDHNPLSSTLEIVETDKGELLLSFELSDFNPPTFNFSLIILGEASATEGHFFVFNGTVSHANGTTLVPECITQAPGEINCTSSQGACGNECYNPENYVCLNGFLCPINHLRCGDDCYDRHDYVCINGTKLCPSEAPLICGDHSCYNSEFFTCENGVLHTIPGAVNGGLDGDFQLVTVPEETVVVVPEETIVVAEETIIPGETIIVIPEPS